MTLNRYLNEAGFHQHSKDYPYVRGRYRVDIFDDGLVLCTRKVLKHSWKMQGGVMKPFNFWDTADEWEYRPNDPLTDYDIAELDKRMRSIVQVKTPQPSLKFKNYIKMRYTPPKYQTLNLFKKVS